jgi:sec-independent protein translocase protein TatA
MTPMAIFGLGVPELLIILAVVLLLFGGSRLAGLGKSTGRALKEFKEETKGLKPEEKPEDSAPTAPQVKIEPTIAPTWQQPPQSTPEPNSSDLRKDA